MKVIINNYKFELQENDEVEFQEHECGRCECSHNEISVTRKGKRIAHFGEYVHLHDKNIDKGDEIFGGVVLDRDNKPEPDHIWQVHIANGYSDDTPRHYKGWCGQVPNKWDRLIFTTKEIEFLSDLEQSRLCPICKDNCLNQKAKGDK